MKVKFILILLFSLIVIATWYFKPRLSLVGVFYEVGPSMIPEESKDTRYYIVDSLGSFVRVVGNITSEHNGLILHAYGIEYYEKERSFFNPEGKYEKRYFVFYSKTLSKIPYPSYLEVHI